MPNTDKEDKLLSKNKSSINAYMKYSGMGIQMALTIGVFAWLGVKIDEWLTTPPAFTVALSLFGVALSLYVAIRQILADGEKTTDSEEDTL